ncbi:MAG TPA: hypothetical protein QGI07_11085 [Dehalococcoidia bacterium]|nr:hypothetical protein [Chloroflexota bacterium]MDP5877162.1 hypothetical protein [Dehalococcoidia bacterium]MDP6272699.1 hypothetical protein [Dehalococcoidia bacterium]MDP7161017.1 hypothetical protein [Dehalococcoidia bacterium]MDP7213930.1 hypothetical protein [Dehalococcoidia bacterium]
MTGEATGSQSGRSLLPGFWEVGASIHSEIEGLTEEQLNWTSDRFEWAAWSISRQTSHMASMLYRWMLLRWGDQLYPDGSGRDEKQVTALAASATDRALDENLFQDIDDITRALDNALALARAALTAHTVDQMRNMTIESEQGPHWDLMINAHPTGIDRNRDTGVSILTMEGTFRHMYFELITHTFNIQRLKRAQGLETVVDLPWVGYYTLDGWDISEA